MAPIEHGDGEQIEDRQVDVDEGEKPNEVNDAESSHRAKAVDNSNRATHVLNFHI